MNSLVFVVVLGLFSASLEAALPTCPPEDPPYPVYFPDTTNCSQFYECANGVPYLKSCLPGLDFDPILDVCDTPRESKCNYSSSIVLDETLKTKTNQINKVPMRIQADPNCQKVGQLLPNPADCSSFFECTEEGPVLLLCPNNSEFNVRTNECDDPIVAGCSPKTCNNIGQLLPNPADCHSFFECALDGPELISCPDDLEFNPRVGQCQDSSVAGCTASSAVSKH